MATTLAFHRNNTKGIVVVSVQETEGFLEIKLAGDGKGIFLSPFLS